MEEIDQNFNHLKIHTQYSICEGAIKIDDLKNFCKENKIPVICFPKGIGKKYNDFNNARDRVINMGIPVPEDDFSPLRGGMPKQLLTRTTSAQSLTSAPLATNFSKFTRSSSFSALRRLPVQTPRQCRPSLGGLAQVAAGRLPKNDGVPFIDLDLKDTQKEITEIYQELSYEDLTNVLNEWLNPDEETTETSTEEPKKPVNEFDQKLAEDKAKKESASKVQDASQQFDDLFNN